MPTLTRGEGPGNGAYEGYKYSCALDLMLNAMEDRREHLVIVPDKSDKFFARMH